MFGSAVKSKSRILLELKYFVHAVEEKVDGGLKEEMEESSLTESGKSFQERYK